jgi:hypothetical protein
MGTADTYFRPADLERTLEISAVATGAGSVGVFTEDGITTNTYTTNGSDHIPPADTRLQQFATRNDGNGVVGSSVLGGAIDPAAGISADATISSALTATGATARIGASGRSGNSSRTPTYIAGEERKCRVVIHLTYLCSD